MDSQPSQPSFTPRAVAVGLLAVIALAGATQFAELWVHGTQVSQAAPPINGVFVWVIVAVLVNAIFRAVRRSWALGRGELLLIYSMLIVGGGVAGIGFVHFIPSTITTPIYYGSPDKPWTSLLEPYIPTATWFGPRDELVVRYLFEGMPPGWTVPWRPWVAPLSYWTVLGLLLAWCSICVCVLLRRQWVENEKLIFPLNYVPLAMTDPAVGAATVASPFFRNRLMWAGFAIPTILHAFNSLHYYWPAVPELKIRDVPIDQGLTARPWNAARPLGIWFYPMAVGLSYLLSRDISHGLWFFYFLGKAEAVLGAALGLGAGGQGGGWADFPFLEEQSTGALLMLALGSLWAARKHLASLGRQALGAAEDHEGEALPPAVAVWGLAVGVVLIAAWWKLAGMSVVATGSYFLLWLLMAIGLSRLVCEAGTVWIGTPMDPRTLLRYTVGVPGLSPRDWTMMGYLRFLSEDWRCLLMPNAMSGLKFTEGGQLRPRGLVFSMMLGTGVSIVVSFATVIYMAYTKPGGGLGLSAWRYIGVCQEPFQVTGQYLIERGGPALNRVAFMVVGGGLMAVMQALRGRFLWWPLHPLGYPMASTFAMRNMWFSVFLAWTTKSLVLRYGGVPVYERSRPFFLGLILGDFFNIALWIVVEGLTGVKDHFLYP
jgi:hypothetical protein